MTGRHADLAEFMAGRDQRQLYARDTRLSAGATLRYIRDGEAERLRAECRAGVLVCPVPDCADPRYTTVGGAKRDHFRHLSLVAGVHAPESYFHFTGKHLIGAWARSQHPEATVHVDEKRVRSDDGKARVPDVLVEFIDGRRFAFEVQYASLTLNEWRERHDSYAAQGIIDVWLWGHEQRYLRTARDHYERIHLGPVLFAARRAGLPLHWINPDEGLVATCRDASDPWTEKERRHGRRGRPHWESVNLAFEPLSDCRIDGDRFVTPLQRYETEHRSEIAAELLRQRDKQRRERDDRKRAKEREARRLEEKRAYAQRKADEEYERDIKPLVKRRFADAIDVIEVALQHDRAIYRSPAHWHAKLFELFIEGSIGTIFTFDDVMRGLIDKLPGRVDDAPLAAYRYLLLLAERGYLECRLDDRRLITDVLVLADSEHPPTTGEVARPKAPEAQPGIDRPRSSDELSEIVGLTHLSPR